MLYKLLRYLIIAVLIAAGIFALLNMSYFSKQVGYFFNKTFLTETQRDFARSENPVASVPNQLYIPSLDILAPIIYVESTNEEVFQKALQDGVVQYPNTAKIGTVGNTYIFGHSSDFALSKGSYKTVFALLPSIEKGEEILVTDEDGEQFVYKVYDKFVAKNTDTYLLKQDTQGRKILTLQTSYPVGTALQRYIIKAEMIEKTK